MGSHFKYISQIISCKILKQKSFTSLFPSLQRCQNFSWLRSASFLLYLFLPTQKPKNRKQISACKMIFSQGRPGRLVGKTGRRERIGKSRKRPENQEKIKEGKGKMRIRIQPRRKQRGG